MIVHSILFDLSFNWLGKTCVPSKETSHILRLGIASDLGALARYQANKPPTCVDSNQTGKKSPKLVLGASCICPLSPTRISPRGDFPIGSVMGKSTYP